MGYKIKRKRKIMNKKSGTNAFLKAFLIAGSAPVPSITHWLRAKMPAATFKQSTTGRCEFVKNAFKKKCSCCHFLIHDLSFSFIYIPYNRTLFKSPQRMYVKRYWLIISVIETTGRCVCMFYC